MPSTFTTTLPPHLPAEELPVANQGMVSRNLSPSGCVLQAAFCYIEADGPGESRWEGSGIPDVAVPAMDAQLHRHAIGWHGDANQCSAPGPIRYTQVTARFASKPIQDECYSKHRAYPPGKSADLSGRLSKTPDPSDACFAARKARAVSRPATAYRLFPSLERIRRLQHLIGSRAGVEEA